MRTKTVLTDGEGGREIASAEIAAEQDGGWRLLARRFFRHRLAGAGLVLFALLALMALLAPLFAPYDPYAVGRSYLAPSWSDGHLLGTDQSGRDVLSRLIYASRVSLSVGVGAVAIYVAIGTLVGAIAGYFGGWVDSLAMRITDVFMSFPYLMVILVMVSVLGPSLGNIILALGLLGWPSVARLIRGGVLSVKEKEFVKAGIALGYSTPRLLFLHILPNVIAPVLVNATFGIAVAIITEASLSFLGMGVQPPTASWGNMLIEAQSFSTLSGRPWLWVPPSCMIIIAVISINFMGDGLRDVMDPKGRR
ncbi:peptide ABC transporter permease [Paenibacillus sp. 598K]|uniref:oligopeptide ABC transporter permease n=1 Tax=Paenibacillus sp. 598K TaxID=1117987 RepID=UPI000FFA27F6|nr:oligopeptide ABC transporter permease [Paenibacillus sp. 598K]GBF72471.1 peptide ABC transporter permease [Paenibacillus sp. 598K]